MTSPEIRERLEQSIGDRYKLDRELGRGGMAIVYLATDTRHDRQVALKVMHPDLALALGRERFLREIRFAAKLSHPHILTVHDSGDANGLLYYVMPYAEGETLRDRLKREKQLPVRDAVHVAREVADALGYAHASGIVHRDIKPENILLSSGHAVVADFGIASAVDLARDEHLTATGTSLGTPAYMSPEQAMGENVDARADVWALGCVLFEMLAGEPPFGREPRMVLSRSLTGPPPSILKSCLETPRAIAAIIERSLARNVGERFPSGSAVVEAINDFEGRPTVAPVPADISRPLEVAAEPTPARVTPAQRNQARAWLAAGIAVLVVGAVVGLLAFRGSRAANGPPGKAHANSPAAAPRMSHDSVANQFYYRARSLIARRNHASVVSALDFFQRAIQRDSSFALAWAGLSRAAQFMSQRGLPAPGLSGDSLLAIAINASERALDLDSTNAEIWVVRSRAVFAADPTDPSPREVALNNAIDIDPEYSDAWSDRAQAMEERFETDEAQRDWEKAIALNPKNFTALAFYSLHYMWNKQPALGLKWADSAVAVDPTYILGREAAGNLLVDLGQLDKAERQFLAYLRITSGREQVNALAGLARVAAGRGDAETARSHTRRAAALADSLHPTKHESVLVAEAFAAIGDTAAALRWLSRYQPREDLHFQLHLKKDPALRWLYGPHGKGLLTPNP
jgi:tRNA A-37 threonylcarbamoyl transferase component Bud32/Tfp pilus assembly protein PilF